VKLVDWKRIGIGIAAAIVLGAAVYFLFGGKTIDSADLESDLAAQVAQRADVAEDAVDVSCPDDVEVEAGKVFDCEATLEGDTATIEVELTDDDGHYEARVK
jgi:Domain of unknown function (DUF4333)